MRRVRCEIRCDIKVDVAAVVRWIALLILLAINQGNSREASRCGHGVSEGISCLNVKEPVH